MDAIRFSLSADQQQLQAEIVVDALRRQDAPSREQLLALIQASDYRRFKLDSEALQQLLSSAKSLASSDLDSPVGVTTTVTLATRIDAELKLKLSEDRMRVEAQICSAYGGAPVDAPCFKRALVKAGIRHGIDTQAASQLMKKAYRAEPGSLHSAVIAKGRAAVKGRNGHWNSLIETSHTTDRPSQHQEGLIDLLDYGEIPSVQQGDLLMELVPPGAGEPGADVCGQVLEAEPGREAEFVESEGVELSADGKQLIAARAGLPVEIPGGMRVDNIYVVSQVDVESGHIEFDGSVVVRGDVAEMMKVVASGDITIGGSIQSAYLQAGGDLQVRKGVVGHQRSDDDHHFDSEDLTCELYAKGDIHVGFAQYARLQSEGDILVDKQLIHCLSQARQSLKVGRSGDRNAKLIGGVSRVGKQLVSGDIGTDAFIPTQVELYPAAVAEIDQQMAQLVDAVEQQEQQLAEVKEQLSSLSSQPKTPENQKAYKQALRQSIEVGNQAVEWDQKRQELKEKRKGLFAGVELIARKTLYPGVTLSADDNQLKNQQQHEGGGYSLVDGDICYQPELKETN
ncbi:FapA family protein [Motiliproteus coralliicola]|uniref:FapA family protein n=1 Tax=Motiliproteus coralliicola TaxID=2283196 RepID=UPI0010587EFC|nr:FapA family protein [Motiliproteus coralliicola]